MRKISVIIPFLLIAATPAFAQKKFPHREQLNPPFRLSDPVKYVEWAENPKVHPLPPEWADQPAIILKRDIFVDYRYEGRGTSSYVTEHYIIKVLNEEGIETYNKQLIEVPYGSRIPLIKARTINPDGKVYEIAKEMMKTTTGTSGNAVSVVLEKVERNSEIEIVIKRIYSAPDYNREYFQFDVPVLSSRFELSYPKELQFEMKSHNGFPELRDTIVNKRKHFTVELADVAPIETEPYSMPNLHRMSLEYRLKNYSQNTERPRVNTWDDYARKMWDDNYKFSQKEKAAVNKFLSELGVRANSSEAEKIKKIEDGIKTKITLYGAVDYDLRKEVLASRDFRSISIYSAYYDDKKEVLDSIIAKKATTARGMIKLFAACFTQAEVEHQLGSVGDKRDYTFYKNFENWEGMKYSVFYFPNLKKFLSPSAVYLRYPIIPASLTGGKGVFCTIPPNGAVKGNLFAFRTVTPLAVNESQETITANVSFDRNMDAKIDMANAYTGYNAIDFRTNMALARKDKMKDLVKENISFVNKLSEIEKYTISNDGFENYHSNKPLEIYASVNTTSLTEKAGANYLFNLGAVAGSHGELYAEKERQMPLDILYPNGYNKTITVNIPKGYKILNPEAVQMSADYIDANENMVISFTSNYTIQKDSKNGDKMIITVKEFYNQVHFPVSEYDRIRQVINTSADFNKVKLLIGRRSM
jgi:hypothetical protein